MSDIGTMSTSVWCLRSDTAVAITSLERARVEQLAQLRNLNLHALHRGRRRPDELSRGRTCSGASRAVSICSRSGDREHLLSGLLERKLLAGRTRTLIAGALDCVQCRQVVAAGIGVVETDVDLV
jgi:hypothetical protein